MTCDHAMTTDTTITRTITLFYREGTSDKVYKVQIEPEAAGTFAVNAYYGRRGALLTFAPKGAGFDLAKATAVFEKAVNEKTAKGYKAAPDATTMVAPAAVAGITQRADTGLRPQLLNAIDRSEAPRYLRDDAWCLQMKYDGVRLLVRVKDGKLWAGNRKGQSTTIPAGVRHILARGQDFEVDGELVGGKYFVFDLLRVGNADLRRDNYEMRHDALSTVFGPSEHVAVAPRYDGTDVKIEAFERALALHLEGVVFKRLDAPFSVGRPASGGSQLKCKFWATASCVINAINDKASVSVAMFDGDLLVPVGSVTTTGHAPFAIGDVVEVRYLYVKAEGGRLYQPTMLGKRTDVDAHECTIDQIKLTGGH